MDKICEFCGAPRPVVYCIADAAFLCLSCDAKVHSANALSGRHSRTMVCDSCRVAPAHVRCLDHLMLMCSGCETRLHQSFPHHRNHIMSSFTGCPSAKHFATLWGFGGDHHLGHGSGLVGQFGSDPYLRVAKDLSRVKFKNLGSSRQHKILVSHRQEQKRSMIKQQILELEKLQISEGNNQSSRLQHYRDPITSTSTSTSSDELVEGLNKMQPKEDEFCISNDLQSFENQCQELKLDQFSCSSSVGVGDPFWQCKTYVDNSQFWSQNLQDLGVCEDLGSMEDLNIPDVDLTFRNFDDLFTPDLDLTRARLEDQNMAFSHTPSTHSMTTQGIRDSSSISMRKGKTSSFSGSRLSNESSGSECLDSGQEVSNTSAMVQAAEGDALRKDTRKPRMQGKQSQLAPRKAKGEMHKKIKVRSMSLGGYESDSLNITNSY